MITTITFQLESCVCPECGIIYGVPDNYLRARRNDHGTFYCPNRHPQYIPAKSDVEKLREQVAEEKRKLAHAQFELMAAEKKTRRLERRIKQGVCPCCNRQFVQLNRHMKSKHPEYAQN